MAIPTRSSSSRAPAAGAIFLKSWLPGITLVLSFLPGTGTVAEEVNSFRLYARPSICVSYDSDALCSMALEVSWESDVHADVCLREQEQDPMLRCWENARQGTMELVYADTQDVRYALVDAVSESLLAETEVVVINRDLRDSRKRRRHVWSIL